MPRLGVTSLLVVGTLLPPSQRTNALEDQANLILEAVMTGFRPEELDLNLRAVACRALNNSLGFLAGNMSVKQERRSIFDSYLDACVCEGSKKLRLLAYKVVSRIFLWMMQPPCDSKHLFSCEIFPLVFCCLFGLDPALSTLTL